MRKIRVASEKPLQRLAGLSSSGGFRGSELHVGRTKSSPSAAQFLHQSDQDTGSDSRPLRELQAASSSPYFRKNRSKRICGLLDITSDPLRTNRQARTPCIPPQFAIRLAGPEVEAGG